MIPPSPGDLTVWPRFASPAEVGKALAEHFVTGTQGARFSGYPYVCTFYGAMAFAAQTHDDALRDRLIAMFDPMLPGGTGRTPQRHHVDDSIFGVMPLQIAIQTKGLASYDRSTCSLASRGRTGSGGRWRRTLLRSCRRTCMTRW